MKFFLGKKIEMTQVFLEDGKVKPATLIEAGPMTVLQIKTEKRDGYNAVQFGFGSKNPKRIKNPQKGHLKKTSNTTVRWMKEFKTDKTDAFKEGDVVNVSVLKEGDGVSISALSKGKGFQGVVRRHGFAGGPRSHGQKHSEREPGSIGATGPQRVLKGQKMPGRMGGKRITVKGLRVLKIEPEKNLLFISGATPGRRGTLVEIVKQN